MGKVLKFIGWVIAYFVCKILPIILICGLFAYTLVISFAYGDVSGIFAIKDIIHNGLF